MWGWPANHPNQRESKKMGRGWIAEPTQDSGANAPSPANQVLPQDDQDPMRRKTTALDLKYVNMWD
jgi:hypothetical protein